MSLKYREIGLALVSAAILTGCATRPANMKYTLGAAMAPPNGTVQLVDGRPAEARDARGPSLFGSREPKWFYGDDQFSPDRLSVLRRKLEARLVAGAPGPLAVMVSRFEVVNHYAKTDADLRTANNPGMMFGAVGALVGAVVAEVMKPSVEPEDQILCEIQGSVEGRPFAANFARSYQKTGGWGRNQFDDPAVQSIVSTVLDVCTEMAAQSAAGALAVAQR